METPGGIVTTVAPEGSAKSDAGGDEENEVSVKEFPAADQYVRMPLDWETHHVDFPVAAETFTHFEA